MKHLFIFTALVLITSVIGQTPISPCSRILVDENAGIFQGMGVPKGKARGQLIVSARPYDSATVDSNHISKAVGGKSSNPQNLILQSDESGRCIDRMLSIQDTLFSWSLVDLTEDRWLKFDSIMSSDSVSIDHEYYLCLDFSREQKLIRAAKKPIDGRITGSATINICRCYTEDSQGVQTPCVW